MGKSKYCLEEEAGGGVMCVCVGGMCRDHVQQGSCVGVIRGFV